MIRDFGTLCTVFRVADEHRMAIVVHARSTISKGRPYGRPQAEAFLRLVECAPHVPVQIAPVGGGGNWNDPMLDAVIATYAEAIAKRDLRVANLWFDVSGVAGRNSAGCR